MMFLLRTLAATLVAVVFTGAPALGGTLDERAKILRAEMTRDAALLQPWLMPDADPALRRTAIRALGRIGDDGTGPGMLRDMLATETKELRLLLWSAGIARTKDLAEPIAEQLAKQLAAKQWIYAAEAARALGWTGADGLGDTLRPLLVHPEAAVRAGALEGLGRSGAKERKDLFAASKLVDDANADVRAAAFYASWLIASRYRGEATKADKDWDGDSRLAKRFLPALDHPDADVRMGGIRVLGSLLPKACPSDGPFSIVYSLIADIDVRVAQDAVGRIFTRRKDAHSSGALLKALSHADPKVRRLAAEALGEREGDAYKAALAAAWDAETDARVREVLTVQLVKHGSEAHWAKLAARDDRAREDVVRQMTEAQVLLGSKRKEALQELFTWADPGASQRAGGIHAAVWMEIVGKLEGREHPKLDEWLTGFLVGGYAVDKPDRHFVMSSVIGLVGKNKRLAHADVLLEMLGRTYSGPPHDEIKQAVLHEEVRMAVMGAFADLAADKACPAETKAKMMSALGRHLVNDPSPWVRRAAKKAYEKLEAEPPEHDEFDQSNAWKGVPRAAEPMEGIPASAGDGELLDEKAILKLADWIVAHKPRLVFDTTAGPFAVELDAVKAPVHSVSLLNAVRNGIYDDTRFHRVVPNFVIQGGDPHGHGAGGGGWTVPDELSRNRYVRGALGMPKSVKDDGGCQIFVMHTTYRPLDERYTCYGSVVSGMTSVDKIRVGDRITGARVVLRKP